MCFWSKDSSVWDKTRSRQDYIYTLGSEEQDTVECNQQQNAVESKTRGEKIKISKKKNKTSKRRILKTPVNYIRTTNWKQNKKQNPIIWMTYTVAFNSITFLTQQKILFFGFKNHLRDFLCILYRKSTFFPHHFTFKISRLPKGSHNEELIKDLRWCFQIQNLSIALTLLLMLLLFRHEPQ